LLLLSELFVCCARCSGESSCEVKIEADSNDVNERSLDDRPRPYLNTESNKWFKMKTYLNDHQLIPTGDKLYPCAQCEKCFTSQRYLRSHMNVHSSNYKCTECGKCFQNNHTLTVHRRIHSGEKPFECTVCGERFTTSGQLVQHSRHHDVEKPYNVYSCSECKKRFVNYGNFRKHMDAHSSKYKCTECGKCFKNNQNLTKHGRIHSGEKPFECCVCSKRFTQSSTLVKHCKTHIAQKQYK